MGKVRLKIDENKLKHMLELTKLEVEFTDIIKDIQKEELEEQKINNKLPNKIKKKIRKWFKRS